MKNIIYNKYIYGHYQPSIFINFSLCSHLLGHYQNYVKETAKYFYG